jgi:hypothetical protein
MQNQTKAIFATLQDEFESANADQGLGSLGEWPPQGEHNCYVLDINVTADSKFKEAVAGGGQEHPAVTIQFRYQLMEDPDRVEPLVFKGAPITIPQDPSSIQQEGSQIRARIELQRLKGHLKTILGSDPVDLNESMELVEKMLSGETSIATVVRCVYTTRGSRTYRTEYIQSLLCG